MKPLTVLQPVLTLPANNLDTLPAVGGAVEDLLRPDVDEMEDMLINRDSREVTDFLETPRPDIRFGSTSSRRLDITSILAGLPFANRTVAYSAHGGRVAFWYVRLREQKEVDYPLMGVVKVELPCPDQEPVDSELADLLSRALVAERNVTPYGHDNRWHCHLYSIFLAEQAIKNGFYSKDVLMGMIRWPL